MTLMLMIMSRSDKGNENNVVDNGHDEHTMDNGNTTCKSPGLYCCSMAQDECYSFDRVITLFCGSWEWDGDGDACHMLAQVRSLS